MAVRAKFKIDSITKSMNGNEEMSSIHMSPVYANNDPEHENSKFWRYSPGGRLELNCVNPAAVEQFQLGAEYYIDFTKAEAK